MRQHKVKLLHAPTGQYIDEFYPNSGRTFPKKTNYIHKILTFMFNDSLDVYSNQVQSSLSGPIKMKLAYANNIILRTATPEFLSIHNIHTEYMSMDTITYYTLSIKVLLAYRAIHCIDEFVLENIT